MKIDILTLFPEMFQAIQTSILGKAESKGILDITLTDIRDYTIDKHKKTDDSPFGGGVGMVMTCQPIFHALNSLRPKLDKKEKILYMSPKGAILNQDKIQELAREERLVILCGHYEGVDQRVIEHWEMEEVSIGDYVLTGGEPAAIVLVDAVARLIPGVLGSGQSIMEESIYSGILEHPQYTKPREYESLKVPEVLVSGNHKQIYLWQFEQALTLTKKRRIDLFEKFCNDRENTLTKEEKKILKKVKDLV